MYWFGFSKSRQKLYFLSTNKLLFSYNAASLVLEMRANNTWTNPAARYYSIVSNPFGIISTQDSLYCVYMFILLMLQTLGMIVSFYIAKPFCFRTSSVEAFLRRHLNHRSRKSIVRQSYVNIGSKWYLRILLFERTMYI